MSFPNLNESRIRALPLRDSDSILSIPCTCMRFRRRTDTTLFSSSLALTSGRETATVISGISISGINETGKRFDATMPRRSNARKVITTATGREIRNLTMAWGLAGRAGRAGPVSCYLFFYYWLQIVNKTAYAVNKLLCFISS